MPLSNEEKNCILQISGKYDDAFDSKYKSENKDFVVCMSNSNEESDIHNMKSDYKCDFSSCRELKQMNLNDMKYHLQNFHEKNIITFSQKHSIHIAYSGIDRYEFFEKNGNLYIFFVNTNDDHESISFGINSIRGSVNEEVAFIFECNGQIKLTTEWTKLINSNGKNIIKFTKINFSNICNNFTTCRVAIVFL